MRPVQKIMSSLGTVASFQKINLPARCLSCRKSSPTMLTQSNLIGIPRAIDHNDPTDVHFFLDCFEKYQNTTDKRTLPDKIRFYGRAMYARNALKGRTEFASLEKVSNQIPGTQAHVPDTYAHQLLGMSSSSLDSTIL